jgi:hypothetical protein
MNAIGGVGNALDLNRNLWIFLRNAWVRRQPHPPMPKLVSPSDITVPEKAAGPARACGGRCPGEGHIDLQA